MIGLILQNIAVEQGWKPTSLKVNVRLSRREFINVSLEKQEKIALHLCHITTHEEF